MLRYLLILTAALSACFHGTACTGGTNAGTLTPGTAYSTTPVTSGHYFVINAVCGYTYTFSFCNGGGSATFDTQITINQTDNTTQLAYNDDNCGLQSEVSWTAPSNQTIHVLVSQYNCNNSGAVSGTLAYQATAPSTSYTIGCTSATATTTGGCSNSFSFNPSPSDGATIDPSTGFISNATAGASYTVEFNHSGGTQVLPITMGNPPCYTLNGDASYITVSGESCIELTAAANDETGCAWSESQIDFDSDFTLSLDYYFGNNVGGADGTTFTFQPNPGACGNTGAQLGAGGIANALIVEFDTYDNDGASTNDLTCDHISVEIDSDLPDDPANFPSNAAPYCGPVCAISGGASIENGSTHAIEISWNAATQQLDVFFDGNNRLSCTGDFVNTVFGGQNIVYWGATAATGGLNNQQYFCPETVIILPVEIASFEASCSNEQLNISWIAQSEINLDYYTVEYTSDGLLYHPLQTIDASTSAAPKTYNISVDKRYMPYYFRLKSHDYDGAIKTTELIKPKHCNPDAEWVLTSLFQSGQLQLASTQGLAFSYDLFDATGKRICSGVSESTTVNRIVEAPQGIYFLNVVLENGVHIQSKLPHF